MVSKGVFDQLDLEALFTDGDSDDGITNWAAPFRERAILGRGRHQRATLARADAFERRAESVAGTRLDLDDHQVAAAPADEVELTSAGEEPRADDLVAARPQKGGRGAFARAP